LTAIQGYITLNEQLEALLYRSGISMTMIYFLAKMLPLYVDCVNDMKIEHVKMTLWSLLKIGLCDITIFYI